MELSMLRYEDRASLIHGVAALLCSRMAAHQTRQGSVSLCLTGGPLANAVYDKVARLAPTDPVIKPDQVSLWWNWDYFVATDDPRRNSLQALSRLAGALPLDPAKIHPMPSSSTASDPETAAIEYSTEVTSAPIDLALVEVTNCGQISGLLSHQLPESPNAVVAVSDIDPQKIIMTPAHVSTAKEIWILASGPDIADCIFAAASGDLSVKVADLIGMDQATWMIDQDAASLLAFHECLL